MRSRGAWDTQKRSLGIRSAHQSGTTAFALGSRLPTEMANKGIQLQSLSKVFVLLSIMTVTTNPLETGKEMEGQFQIIPSRIQARFSITVTHCLVRVFICCSWLSHCATGIL